MSSNANATDYIYTPHPGSTCQGSHTGTRGLLEKFAQGHRGVVGSSLDVVDSYHIFWPWARLVYTSVRTAYTSVCVVVPYARHSAPLAPSGHPVMVPECIFWPEHSIMIGHP